MRQLPPPNDLWSGAGRTHGFSRWQILGIVAISGALLAFLFLSGSWKGEPAAANGPEVYAAWYHVPEDSLAHRRADGQEFTAAHNKLPLGTLVRVTRLKNGKTLTVRITDRGIHNRQVQLDLCQEAAEQLEMIHKGIARVRMEVISEPPGAPPPASNTTAAQP